MRGGLKPIAEAAEDEVPPAEGEVLVVRDVQGRTKEEAIKHIESEGACHLGEVNSQRTPHAQKPDVSPPTHFLTL